MTGNKFRPQQPVKVPVHVTGTWHQPAVEGVDVAAFLQGAGIGDPAKVAQAAAEEARKRVEEEAARAREEAERLRQEAQQRAEEEAAKRLQDAKKRAEDEARRRTEEAKKKAQEGLQNLFK